MTGRDVATEGCRYLDVRFVLGGGTSSPIVLIKVMIRGRGNVKNGGGKTM